MESSSAYAYRNMDGYHGPGYTGPASTAGSSNVTAAGQLPTSQQQDHSDAVVPTAEQQQQAATAAADPNTLKVDFHWRARSAKLTPLTAADDAAPAYVMLSRFFHMPNLVFKRGGLKGEVFATAANQFVAIDSTYTLGAPGETDRPKQEIRAAKRLVTEYTHQSYNYNAAGSTGPATMTWKTTANLKNWDFVCCDEQMVPVARFHSNVWYLKKVGLLEFMGPKAADPAAREEIIVVALTIYHQMLLRMNNVLNLLGAIPKPKPFKAGEGGAAGAEADGRKAPELESDEEDHDGAFAEVDAVGRKKAGNAPVVS